MASVDMKTFLFGLLTGISLMAVAFHFVTGQIRVRQEEMLTVHNKALIREKSLQGNLSNCNTQTLRVKNDVQSAKEKQSQCSKDLEGHKKTVDQLNGEVKKLGADITKSQKSEAEKVEKIKVLEAQVKNMTTELTNIQTQLKAKSLELDQGKKGWFN